VVIDQCCNSLKVEDLKTYFGLPHGELRAVDGVSFRIEPGTLATLLGPSGCGKTTTLKMINRLIEPSAGQILVAGEDVLPELLGEVLPRPFAGAGIDQEAIGIVHLGPEVVGGRPRDYQQQLPEPVRNRLYVDSYVGP